MSERKAEQRCIQTVNRFGVAMPYSCEEVQRGRTIDFHDEPSIGCGITGRDCYHHDPIYAPLPSAGRPEQMEGGEWSWVCGDCGMREIGLTSQSVADARMAWHRELAHAVGVALESGDHVTARLSPAPETPSPEVGERERLIAILDGIDCEPGRVTQHVLADILRQCRAALAAAKERDLCDGWTNAFNSFSAGQDWGRKHPDADDEATIDACTAHADAVSPHECPPQPETEVMTEREKALRALLVYAHHEDGCIASSVGNGYCDCGYAAALNRWTAAKGGR